MKKLVTSYTFTAVAKTITAADFTSLEKIQLITNVTRNVIIYNFADPNKGGSLSGTTLTLTFDTSAQADTDKLQIFVEDGTAIQEVQGDVAAGSTDSGNPVKVGGKFNSTQPTLTDGQRGDLNLTSRGNVRVEQHFTTNSWGAAADNADAVAASATQNRGLVVAKNQVFNGTTWDRQYGDATGGTWANIKALGGTAVDTNSGNKSAGTLRVVLATDQPALTNKLLVTPDANSSVNLAQLAGNTISSGVGTSGTGTLRTVIANDTGRTLVSKGGSVASSGDNTLVSAGTNKLKVYAFSLSTTSTTAVTCIFQSGASGTELWRVVLQAPTSTSTGANLVVQPPAWLFATASATLLNLNLSSAQTVHYSVSYFDEA